VYDGALFHMWYSGGYPGIERAGYATSPDGSVWAKDPGNPVIDRVPAAARQTRDFRDPLGEIVLEPADDKLVRRQQPQCVGLLNGLERTDPGVEVLLGKVALELPDTTVPERCRHLADLQV
jgi:hypothetical protein